MTILKSTYKIRKLTVGVCSIGIMTGCYLSTSSAQATDNNESITTTQSFAQVEEPTSDDALSSEAKQVITSELPSIQPTSLVSAESNTMSTQASKNDSSLSTLKSQNNAGILESSNVNHETTSEQINKNKNISKSLNDNFNFTSTSAQSDYDKSNTNNTLQKSDLVESITNTPQSPETVELTISTSPKSELTTSNEVQTSQTQNQPIAKEMIRLQFSQLPSDNIEEIGLWVWGSGVKQPSSDWPQGSMSFTKNQHNEAGYYVDIPVKLAATEINYLLNNRVTGDKFTDDLLAPINSPKQQVIYISNKYEASDIPPLTQSNILRVHYQREDNNYNNWGLWVWGDITESSTDWPTSALDFTNTSPFGNYVDIPLNKDSKQVQFLLVNKETKEQSKDLSFNDLQHYQQVFLKDKEIEVNTSPFTMTTERITYAEQLSPTQLDISFSKKFKASTEDLLKTIQIYNDKNEVIIPEKIELMPDTLKLKLTGAFKEQPKSITYGEDKLTIQQGWKYKDAVYGYTGQLGAKLNEDGSAQLTMWSPSAQQVSVVLYDKDNPKQIVDTIPMHKNEGVWQVTLSNDNTGLTSLNKYFYHYQIQRDGKTILALDPYAKSLAEWNQPVAKEKIAKAAIVDPATIGPKLNYAQIDNYKNREDAIIYEAHVRDFTSDPNIAKELIAPFGTFAAFSERLDYLKNLGVTHVQLLPVMSYYFADEQHRTQRELTPSTNHNNYNWGYDPQSYFALTGMYSKDSKEPTARIIEFKQLINAIHDKGMGVILDVVYNHTAQTHIFESLEPHYYHFMNTDGTPRESFGGARLGTTHQMARRVLVDSIKYWMDEYKVDGFRFDMMGDHDAESIQLAYDEAKKLNPNILMLGEGWRTYTGDEQESAQAADQDWVQHSNSVGVFSDDIRNELKSGFPSEGEPRFLTGGARNIHQIYDNIIAQPHNFKATAPGDVIQYIAAHDNLTLHDVIAQSIKKDPQLYEQEIHQRIRLGNLMILTSQGTPFLHSGQEMGRTKQFISATHKQPVKDVPYKTHYLTDEVGQPFNYPYFVHDSYDSSDIINRFDWNKALSQPINVATREYTTGLIQLRKSTDAFRYNSNKEVVANTKLLQSPDINYDKDLVIAYQVKASNGDIYAIFVNADNKSRRLQLASEDLHLLTGQIIVDQNQAGITPIHQPQGVTINKEGIELAPLTAIIIKVSQQQENHIAPTTKVSTMTPKAHHQQTTKELKISLINHTQSKVLLRQLEIITHQKLQAKVIQKPIHKENLPKTGLRSLAWTTLAGLLSLLGVTKLIRKRVD